MSDYRFWVGFNLVKGIGPAKLQALLDHFGGLSAAWEATERDLRQIGIDQRTINSFFTSRATLKLDEEWEKLQKAGVTVLTWDSADYPHSLRNIPVSPPVLYLKGTLTDADRWAVALVGTRKPTAYGKQVTQSFAQGLIQRNVTIVSGLARGVDALAHHLALEENGRTIAVLGSGLDCIYPTEHRDLAEKIIDGHGALISEYGLGIQPEAKNFPPRNRIISGLSLGTVVIEAGEKSGSLITADFAREQGREVYAIPGNITNWASQGTNELIKSGAKLVTSIDDIVTDLNLGHAVDQQNVQGMLPESAEEAALYPFLSTTPCHIDQLGRESGLPIALVSATLTMMELKGMIRQIGGMQYILTRG